MAGLLYKRHDDHGFTAAQMESTLADGDDMDNGTISVEHIPIVYWEFVGAVVAAFALWYLYEILLCRQRLSAASRRKSAPARPKNFLTRWIATSTAIAREVSNVTLTEVAHKNFRLRSPSTGTSLVAIANAVLLVVLCFYKFDTTDIRNYQHIAYRAGFISLGQIPLLFLLSGKYSILGFLTGYSYERLNWLHRWVARCILLTTTVHLGFWFGDWAPFSYIKSQVTSDYTTQTGLSAWCILVWIVFSSFAPIRNWNYEFFVLQHLVSFIAFVVMILLHTPAEDHVWIWIGVGLFALDRAVRAVSMLYINVSLFHSNRRRQSTSYCLWACKGHLEPLPHGMTRLTIQDPPFSWQPGQHAFVSCHSIVPLQAHPFTITSIPSDNTLEFLVRTHTGGTKQFFEFAEKHVGLPSIQDPRKQMTVPVSLQGPYGRMRPLRQFDSVVLFAGGVGANFVMPLMRDIVHRTKEPSRRTGLLAFLAPPGVVTRHIRLIWVIKSKEQLSWHADQLYTALEDVKTLQHQRNVDLTLDVSVYITCDESLTTEYNTAVMAPPTPAAQADARSPRLLDDVETGRNIAPSCCAGKEQDIDTALGNDVVEVDPRSETRRRNVKTCGPNGTCCCQTTIKNENANAISEAAVCRCNVFDDEAQSCCGGNSVQPRPKSLQQSFEKAESATCCQSGQRKASYASQQARVHPDCTILSGRPHPKTIIRRTLEQAQGETAVIACGPRGMNTDVRMTTVKLSDERAVHKGTGAQGIFFWGEGFGW